MLMARGVQTPKAGGLAVRHWVFAYDICCPRRARRVRKAVAAWQLRAQYSVFEVRMTHVERTDLLAELVSLCDLSADSLACWAPRRCQHVVWSQGKLVSANGMGEPMLLRPSQVLVSGNAVICYDVKDPDRLRRVAATLAPWAVAIQRSVYWLRADVGTTVRALRCATAHCAGEDALIAYPLAHAGDLWLLRPQASSVLPCGGTPHLRERRT